MTLKENVVGVQHLGIPVWDLEGARHWYEEVLGFEAAYQKQVFYPVRFDVVFLQQHDLTVELCCPPAHTHRALRERGHGVMAHYAMDAPDFAACAKRVAAMGAALDVSTPDGCVLYEHIGPKGVRGINFVGPSNEVIELCHDYAEDYLGKTGLQGWSHLALKVADLSKTTDFYARLGFQKTADGYLDTPDGRLWIAFLTIRGFSLEVIQVLPGEAEQLRREPVGHLDHLALEALDAGDALSACRRGRIPLVDQVVKRLPLFAHGVKCFTALGPDGERIEFCEMCKNNY